MSELITDSRLTNIMIVSLGTKDVPIISMARLNCMMFDTVNLFDDLKKHYTFVPSEHGPHCKLISQMVEQLREDGLVAADELSLTEHGKKTRDEILKLNNDEFINYDREKQCTNLKTHLEFTNEFWNRLDDDEFHTLLYHCLSEYISKFDIYNKLKPNMEDILTQMAMAGKLSIGHFAKYMKMSHYDAHVVLSKLGYFNE